MFETKFERVIIGLQKKFNANVVNKKGNTVLIKITPSLLSYTFIISEHGDLVTILCPYNWETPYSKLECVPHTLSTSLLLRSTEVNHIGHWELKNFENYGYLYLFHIEIPTETISANIVYDFIKMMIGELAESRIQFHKVENAKRKAEGMQPLEEDDDYLQQNINELIYKTK